MECPDCCIDTVVFDVPGKYRKHVRDEATRAALCPVCLRLSSAEDEAATAPDEPRFDRIDSAFPQGEGSIPLAIAIGLLDSVALNRSSLETLFRDAEAAGVDPFLLLDRLATQSDVSPAYDLERRRHQLEQILG